MPGYQRHSAAARRNDGVRRVTRLTWRVGLASVICSAVIAVAFGHHAEADVNQPGQQGTILVPNQPPAPAKGAGQVTSGAS